MVKKILSVIITMALAMGIANVSYASETADPAYVDVMPKNGANTIVVRSDATDYNIYRKTNGEYSLLDINSVFAEGKTKVFMDTGLTNDIKYTYLVKAVANGIESDGVELSGTPSTAYGGTSWGVEKEGQFTYGSFSVTGGWGAGNYSTNENPGYGGLYIARGMGIDGSNALKLSQFHVEKPHTYLLMQKGIGGLEGGKTYKLSFMQKAEDHLHWWDTLRIATDKGIFTTTFPDGNTATVTNGNDYINGIVAPFDGQWHESVFYITTNAEQTGVTLKFKSEAFLEATYIDNITLYEVDADKNIVPGAVNLLAGDNGDFEAGYEKPAEAAYVDVMPKNSANTIVVRSDLSNYAIYRKTTGDYEKLNLSPVFTEGKTKVFMDTNLVNDTKYTYCVKTVSAMDVESDGIVLSGTPSTVYGGTPWGVEKEGQFTYGSFSVTGGWGAGNYATNENPGYGGLYVARGKGIDGSNALQISQLHVEKPHTYILVQNYITGLEGGKTYKLSFMQKAEDHLHWWDTLRIRANKGVFEAVYEDGNTATTINGNDYINGIIAPFDGQWHENVYYLTTNADQTDVEFAFQSQAFLEAAYIDNITMYEVDADKNIVPGAVDIFATRNGDFEAGYEKPAEAAYVDVMPKNSANAIVVRSDLADYAIYRKTTGDYEKLNLSPVFTEGKTKVFMDTGLTNDTEYTYLIKTVSPMDVESDGIEITVTPGTEYGETAWGDTTVQGGLPFGEFKVETWGAKNYAPAETPNYGGMYLAPGKGINGSNALKLSGFQIEKPHTYLLVQKNIEGLEGGKTYKLSFMQKAEDHLHWWDTLRIKVNKGTFTTTFPDGNSATIVNGNDYINGVVAPFDGQWHEFVFYLTTNEGQTDTQIEFQSQAFLEATYLDNFTMYEVDEDLNVVEGAENIIEDGSFDERIFTAELDIFAATADDEGNVYEKFEISTLSDLNKFDTDKLYVEADVLNMGHADGKDCTLILAIYKDGELFDVKLSEKKIDVVYSEENSVKTGFVYKMPALDDGIYEAKLMLWNGFKNMTAVSDSVVIGEN